MRKISTIIILMIFPLILTGCSLIGNKNTDNNNSDKSKNENSRSSEKKDLADEIKGTFEDIIKLGKNVKCTYSGSFDDTKTEGSVYVSGNKTRSSASIQSGTAPKISSETIMDGDWVYIWNKNETQGTKMQISKLKDIQKQNENNSTKGNSTTEMIKDINKDYDYKCIPWTVDSSYFNIPTNIQFQDVTLMLEQLNSKSSELKDMAKSFCSTCDNITNDDAKATCKKNLGCE